MNKKTVRYAIKSGQFFVCAMYPAYNNEPLQYYSTTDPEACSFSRKSSAKKALKDLMLADAEVVAIEGK